ncbi:MAG: translation initiation factor IF-2 [Bacteroidales bacterium]
MTEGVKILRLSKVAREFNIGTSTIVEFLNKKGFSVDNNPNTKIPGEAYALLVKEFQGEKNLKEATLKAGLPLTKRESISMEEDKEAATKKEAKEEAEEKELFITDTKSSHEEKQPEAPVTKSPSLTGPKVVGKLDPSELSAPRPSKPAEEQPQPPAHKAVVEKPEEVAASQEPAKEQQKEEKPADQQPSAPADKPAEKPAERPAEPVAKKPDAEKPDAEKPVAEKPAEEKPADTPSQEVSKEAEKEKEQGGLKILGKMDLEGRKPKKKEPKKEEAKAPEQPEQQAPATPAEPAPQAAEKQAGEPAAEKPKDKPAEESAEESKDSLFKHPVRKLEGVTILGKMDLPAPREASKKPVASSSDANKPKKRKRKRIRKDKPAEAQPGQTAGAKPAPREDTRKRTPRKDFVRPEVSDEDIAKQIRETLASLSGTKKSRASKHRRVKRDIQQQQKERDMEQAASEEKTLKVTEFVSAAELANLMNVSVNEIISTCMSMGMFISINQRLDAETITIVADEFGYEVEFVDVDTQDSIQEEEDDPKDLKPRAPIVTVMGHVDHGKTSLLDHIRHANVISGEAGGITQHIGAYSVNLEDGKTITFLDTPGHEAFTAMRARGAKVTDVAIIVVAADDQVMPQTIEAINHAQAAGVPIVIAINKIDKENANVEKVKEGLANINILVEDWGGKYQSQEISAKNGVNIELLLEKVLLEAELLDLKANPVRRATGTVIESSLDKGRGYVSTILVQNGTLKVGEIVVAGVHHGKIKAMFNERGHRITEAGPSSPALILGLDGAPQAGDIFNVMTSESDAKNITNKRHQLMREQGLRTQKHITLDEIGRRIAIGDFQELNVIVKGDVDGSVEALSDSLLKLSTEEIQVNIIHKAVGQITEGDVLLASASNAVIVGFQVRPSVAARKLAEQEEIDIRLYSIIYNAINEIKSAIEGMLSPEIEEKVIANLEVRDVFKITKVGTVAGCMVLDGKINRNSHIRLIRDGIVVFTGYLGSLKRYKDDVREVASGYECGLNIDRFNDIKVGDIIEAFETQEIARKL